MIQDIQIPDPIFRVVKRFSTLQVWLTAVIVNMGFFLVVGWIIDYYYATTPDYLAFDAEGEMLKGINIWLIFAPGVWFLYRWLPEAICTLARQLEQQGNIWNGKEPDCPKNIVPLSERLLLGFNKKRIPIVSFLTALLTVLYYHFVFVPDEFNALGQKTFWFVNPVSHFILLILYFQMACIGWNTVFRGLLIVSHLNDYFKHDKAIKKLYPLHPDYCGGMAGIGRLVIKFAVIFVLAALWQAIIALSPLLEGGQPQYISLFVANIIYVVMMFTVILFPIWRPSQAMGEYKSERLLTISHQLLKLSDESRQLIEQSADDLNVTVSDSTPERSNNLSPAPTLEERIASLVNLHKFLEEGMPTMPITFRAVRRLSVFASSPVLFSVLSFVIQRMI